MSAAPKLPPAATKVAPHINFRNDMFDSDAFRSCGPLARCLLFEIARRRGPWNNGWIHMSVRQAEEACGTTSRKGVLSAIAELCAKGLLIQTFKADQTAPGLQKADNKFTRYMITSHGYWRDGGDGTPAWVEPLGTYMAWDSDAPVDFTDMARKIAQPLQPDTVEKAQEGYRAPGERHVAPKDPKVRTRAKAQPPVPSSDHEDPLPPAKGKAPAPKDLEPASVEHGTVRHGDGKKVLTVVRNAAGEVIAEGFALPGETPRIGVWDDIPF